MIHTSAKKKHSPNYEASGHANSYNFIGGFYCAQLTPAQAHKRFYEIASTQTKYHKLLPF